MRKLEPMTAATARRPVLLRLRAAVGRLRPVRSPRHDHPRLARRIQRIVLVGLLLGFAVPAVAGESAPAPAPIGGPGSSVRFDGEHYTNRLINSDDPYLLMHAHNPVDWYPWGPKALAAAKREHKPIFLSVGYATCYWCHVAEREIYSKPKFARLMNQWFINIKVDREQRPDIDDVYMLATQLMTGAGGWPNNVFLTPDLKPFFAGSYFPPTDRGGRSGFKSILTALHGAWENNRDQITDVADRVARAMQQQGAAAAANDRAPVTPAHWLSNLVADAGERFDADNGGFGDSRAHNKFPQEPLLAALLAQTRRTGDDTARTMLVTTLAAMGEGGVMDQIGGGFHRYSTDPKWSVPHFEKMLYDNAQLLGLYAQAAALTGSPFFRQVAQRTADYMRRDLRADGGGFYSAQDSQVDNVEGASYVWTRDRVRAVLGADDARRFFDLYTIAALPAHMPGQKNADGGVLRLDRARAQSLRGDHKLASRLADLAPLRQRLLAARDRRPQPATDEKIVAADNGLAVLGFAAAANALDDADDVHVAVQTAGWLWHHLVDASDGQVRHQWYHGDAAGDGFLADYAMLGLAMRAAYRITGNAIWDKRATTLADALLRRFASPDGRLTSTVANRDLLVMPQPSGDQVKPSGSSAAVALLLELAGPGGDGRYGRAASQALGALSTPIASRPTSWGAMIAWLAEPARRRALTAAASKTPNSASASTSNAGGGLPSSADHVTATASAASAQSALVVHIAIDKGYHINANPASDDFLVATQLQRKDGTAVAVDYPAGESFRAPFAPDAISVYTGSLKLTVPANQRPPGGLALRVQACNKKYCLAPATIKVPVDGR